MAPAEPQPPTRVRVPFRDVDMHGHVHNAVFLSYVEDAINDFLRRRDLFGHFVPERSGVAYHVRKTELVLEAPAFFQDALEIAVRIDRVGTSSLAFAADVMRLPEAGAAQRCVAASVVWVCVDPAARRAVPIPEETREALGRVAEAGARAGP